MTIGSSKQRSLFNQYRIRIANEYVRIQRENQIESLRRQISSVENEIEHLIHQIPSIDFLQLEKQTQIEQKTAKQLNHKFKRIRKHLLDIKPKLIIGNAYLRARSQDAKPNSFIEPLISLPVPVVEHEFLAPLPPPPFEEEEVIIPFQTPPIPCPSDRLQLSIDDTIVKPRRHANRTLANISQMSFHIDPEQCSSPKTKKKSKSKAKKSVNLPLPPPPLFSSTAIFDTHAFFTQTNSKTRKQQKKKIDISRQPMISMISTKTKSRTKKTSPYEFSDDDQQLLTTTSRTKLLTDDLITARFAKNSHYQTHQSSMASTKCETTKKKKTKKNILGIGNSSPLTLTTNLSLSPGKLDLDIQPSTKSKRKRVK